MHSTGIPVDADRLFDQPLFERLDVPGIEAIARGGWMVEVRRGDRVLGRGDELDGLYFVVEGRLKLYMLSCNGDERVLRVMQAGDSFGEAIMFNGFPSPVFVDALATSELAFFPRDVINDALTSNPAFTDAMLKNMSALMRNLIQDLETCCLQNAMQRTVNYLLRESERTPSMTELVLPASKAVVASLLNMSAETFSRELHRLQDHGLIAIERRRLRLLDRPAIVALSETGQFASAGHRSRH